MNFLDTKSDMRMQLITTTIQNKISGGTIFNQKVVDFFISNKLVAEIVIAENLNTHHFDSQTIYIIDGILLKDNLDLKKLKKFNVNFLIHLWSSLNLNLSYEKRISFLEIEKSICDNFRVFVTGKSSIVHIENTLKSKTDKCFLIKPGIDSNWKKKEKFPEVPQKIIYLSNFIEGKGYFRMLEVANNLKHLDFEIDCYGEILSDEYFSKFIKKTNEFQLNNIHYKGCVPHNAINELLLDYDLLFHFSEYESFGMSILEALSANIPCIITPTGNFAEYKNQEIEGVLDTFDAEKITEEVEKVLKSKKVYQNHILSLQNLKTTSWNDPLKIIFEKTSNQ